MGLFLLWDYTLCKCEAEKDTWQSKVVKVDDAPDLTRHGDYNHACYLRDSKLGRNGTWPACSPRCLLLSPVWLVSCRHFSLASSHDTITRTYKLIELERSWRSDDGAGDK